ncbi:hypothetical protein DYB35_005396 [Aphanomyces astaci]|uniref:RING-type domain-containing protein n=1 Tax=Aphanomyces astaci TaxID=112090 RepID=A0A418DLE3_APHAT|nr:hypothetical protein DYB35_005396 [Aphanomyces astaci]
MNADDFICAVCLEPFASPITLYCGHTFDRECLVNLVGKPCPMCRQGEIRPDVVVQPKNQVMYRLVLSTCANSSDVIASRGIGHEHARLTRLATYVRPKSPSASALARRTISVHWGHLVLVFHSLSFPWSAMYGPAGFTDDDNDDDDNTESSIPCCAQFCSWSIAFTLMASYILSMSLSIAYHVSNLAQTGMKQSALAVADRGFDAALEAPVVKLDAYDLVTRHHGRHLDLPAGGEGSTASLGTRVRGRVEF